MPSAGSALESGDEEKLAQIARKGRLGRDHLKGFVLRRPPVFIDCRIVLNDLASEHDVLPCQRIHGPRNRFIDHAFHRNHALAQEIELVIKGFPGHVIS